jgi:hypothetical protein
MPSLWKAPLVVAVLVNPWLAIHCDTLVGDDLWAADDQWN